MEKFATSVESLCQWNQLSLEEKEACCDTIIEVAIERELSLQEIEKLAIALAKSGTIWKWADDIRPTIDIASSGGAGSLTTLLCPFLVATQGINAPQVSVQGSIAGAIDTLGVIPDYSFVLTFEEMEKSLRTSKVGNTLNTPNLAPADLFLFNKRTKTKTKDLSSLVIASLMSKKIASGIDTAVYDIRVGYVGNFGHTLEEAEKNSRKMVKVAHNLGIDCLCILTNHSFSPIPLYGRLECLKALWSIINAEKLDEWTNEHVETCIKIAALGVSRVKGENIESAEKSIRGSIINGEVLNVLRLNLESQGSSLQSLRELIEMFDIEEMVSIKSPFDAYVEHIDLIKIRDLFHKNYTISVKKNAFDSPIGLTLKVREGKFVKKGEELMKIRSSKQFIEKYINSFEDIIIYNNHPPLMPSTARIYTVIDHA